MNFIMRNKMVNDKIIEKAIKEYEKLTGEIPGLGKVVVRQVCRIALKLKDNKKNK